MAILKLKDTKIFYEEHGKGEPVIFIHGWAMNSSFWKNQVNELPEHFRIIIFDLRGHGKSSKEAKEYTIKAFAQDLKEMIDTLKLNNVHLVGWSMGTSVLFEYILTFGSLGIKSVTLVDGNPKIVASEEYNLGTPKDAFEGMLKQLQSNYKSFIKGFVPVMFNQIEKKETISMQNEILKTPLNVAFESFKDVGNLDYRNLLPRIKIPTLILHGKDDKLNNFEIGNYMLNKILDSKLVCFEKSGHCPHIEEQDKFNTELLKFLKEV